MKNESKNSKRCTKWKKAVAAGILLCLAILLLTQCSTPRQSFFSARPDHVPDGVALQPVMVDGLDADFFHGTAAKPQKAVVLLGGSEGGRSWSYCPDFIKELVDQGFCVLSLPYFATDDLPTHLRAIPLEYFSKAFRWLSAQEERVIPNHYALVGVSRGAELALLLASRHSEVKAVVAIAPSSVVFPGPPTSKFDAIQHSAWSENGKELAFVPMAYSWTTLRGLMTGQQTPMFEKALRNTPRVKAGAIPVEKIRGPVLLVSYTRDQVWPSTFMSEQILQRLRDRSFPFHYRHASYPGGHSEWSTEPCRTNILAFLKDQFLAPVQTHQPIASDEKPKVHTNRPANPSQPFPSKTNTSHLSVPSAISN